jgi:hypothetical protein
MGYYTDFSLTWNPRDENVPSNPLYPEIFDEDGGAYDSHKWYEWQEDMRKLSAQFPCVVFTLYGVGEAIDDEWLAYFKGGKMQLCPVIKTFDPYDERKLE